ncbi:hypothetical protein KY336_01675 [Candidatus Woesearchaeota archaeon]|nr:hypothetical protein [Candidatus Woesearchaeota archaeon]
MRRLVICTIFLTFIIMCSSFVVAQADEKEEGMPNIGYFILGEPEPARTATLFFLTFFDYKRSAVEEGNVLVLVGKILPKVTFQAPTLVFGAVIAEEEGIPTEMPPGEIPPEEIPPTELPPTEKPGPSPGPGTPREPEPAPEPEPEPEAPEPPRITVGKDPTNPVSIPLSGELLCEDGTPVSGATYTFTMASDEPGLIFTPNPQTQNTDAEGKAQTSITAYFNPPGPYPETSFTVTAAVTNVPPGACPGSSLRYTTPTVSTLIAVDP